MSFKKLYEKKINTLCHALGAEWRINHLDSRDHLIIIFNPNIKNFSIQISEKNRRLIAMGFFESKINRYPTLKCTVSSKLPLTHFINHVRRKILPQAIELNDKVLRDKKSYEEKKSNNAIFLNLLKSMSVKNYKGHDGYLNLSLNNSFSVGFNEIGESCDIRINNLNRENAVKIIAFVKNL